jgi:hypothetical protein
MNNYNELYDSAYEADDEYDTDEPIIIIDRQVFVNIGIYMSQLRDEPEDKMCRVLVELIALHGCKSGLETLIMPHVRPCRSSESGLFSLSSNETDDSVFQYYLSEDEIYISN